MIEIQKDIRLERDKVAFSLSVLVRVVETVNTIGNKPVANLSLKPENIL